MLFITPRAPVEVDAGRKPSQERGQAAENKAALVGIVVNHTHWDREWYMPFERYRVLLVDAVDQLFEIFERRSDYGDFLLDGQTVVAEDYLAVRPEMREKLARYVRSGRLALGPWYVLPDEFIPSGEGLIRNLLLGRKQMAELGAAPARVGYLPDTFGHPAQLPQIMAGFDLDSMVIFRGVQSKTSEFIWEAPDGTPLLTVYLPGGYYNAMELARAPEYWLKEKMQPALEQLSRFATTSAVLLMNGCDHFQPQPATQEFLDEANRLQNQVYLRQGSIAEYVQLVQEAAPRLETKRGEWRYNRPARITPGVLSARMYLKQADFQTATILERGAEPLQGIAWALGNHHDSGLLATAWRYQLQNHPHDSICGCSTDEVHRDGEGRYRGAQQIGGDLINRAANYLARQISRPEKPGFAVFNTLATPRQKLIQQKIHFLEPGAQFSLTDSTGQPVPYQEIARRPMKIEWDPQRENFFCEGRTHPAVVVSPAAIAQTEGRWKRFPGEEVEILFPANLPAGGHTVMGVGYQVSGVGENNSALSTQHSALSKNSVLSPQFSVLETNSELKTRNSELENEHLRVEVAEDGSFSLTDKATGRKFGPLNVFRSEADRGDEYSYCPAENDQAVYSRGGQATVRLVENGPLRATLEISLTMQVPAKLAADRTQRVAETVELPVRSYVSLSAGMRRIEVRTEVENTAQDHRFRALFGTGVKTEFADAQGQFEVTRRAVELSAEERARVPEFDEEQEVSYHPQRNFVDVSDANGGFAVLNKGLPEYEGEPSEDGVIMGITLLRAVGWLSRDDLSTRYKHAGPPLQTPEAQCPGKHVFEYAVLPHAGDWVAGGVAQEAEGYVTPVYSAPVPDKEQGGTLPAEVSFYRLGPSELLFSACKRREDGQGLILRAYNPTPYPVEATLELGAGCVARLANMAERELSEPLVPLNPIKAGQDPLIYRFPVRANQIITLSIRSNEQQGA
jgi:alpha-mannosidase